MIAYPVAIAVAVLAVSLIASGSALLRVRRAQAAAVLLVASGLGLLLGIGVDARGAEEAARQLLTAVGLLLVPLAVIVYPRVTWRAPVDVAGFVVVSTAGAVATLGAERAPVVGTIALLVPLTLTALVWWRLERDDGRDRWSQTWLALGLGTSLMIAGFVAFAVPGEAGVVVATLLCCAVGPCMYLGVHHSELVDVRGLVVHVTVFVTAAIVFLSLFVGAASLLELLAGRPPALGLLGILGAALATLFHPTRVVLRGVFDELLFGRRPDPLGAAGAVADHLGDDPAQALAAIRHALVLPYVALRVDGELRAESGVDVTHTRIVPLPIHDQLPHGELVVGLRPGDLGLAADDERVLRLVAPLLSQTVHARALADDLHASRENTIAAIEEERRRLRRDLHDGMGPRLSGIAFLSDAVLNSVRRDPDTAEELLRTMRGETVQAIADIRRLVYDMRPPALDELGLVLAIEQQAASLWTPSGRPVEVSVSAEGLPPLTAAVEVATFRIVVEALVNAASHSGSTAAAVSLREARAGLVVVVTDHGNGRTTWSPGVGIASMRERADAVGGTLDAGPTPQGGQVTATLPVARSA